MPLKLRPPRPGKTPYYTVRGTYLGVRVEQSTGLADRKKAQRFLDNIRAEIEAGRLSPRGETTFAEAVLDYLEAGHDGRFVERLLKHFDQTPLSQIDQAAIDKAARDLYPDGSPATRNRAVYTPVSAILKRAGVGFGVKRPKGHAGKARTDHLTPRQFEALHESAPDRIKPVVRFLVYTGCRLGEALNLAWGDIDIESRTALVRQTKGGEPRAVHLTDDILADIEALPRDTKRVFGWAKSGRFYAEWRKMTERAGLEWATPHVMRHTYGTWMRRYAGRDLKGLVATGAWRDLKSVARYAHAIPTEEARMADLLPRIKDRGKRGGGDKRG